jgi:hypothetical protein
MPGVVRRLLVTLTVGAVLVLAVARGDGSFTETDIASFVGYNGHVYRYVDQIGMHSGVPNGFTKAVGRGHILYGDGPYHSEKNDEGWVVYSIPHKPTRIALQNSWGGGYNFFNIYELDPSAKWKR